MATLCAKGVPVPAAFAGAVLVATALGAHAHRLLIRPQAGASVGSLIVMTIAVSMTLRGLALLVWGKESQVVAPFSRGKSLSVLGATLQPQVLWILGITLLVLLAIWLFFEKTTVGIAMRACAEDRLGASLMGISPERSALLSWAWGSGIGALAGASIAPLLFMQYSSGVMPMVKGFVAMSIGGLSSIAGAVVAGILLGVVEGYTIGLVSSQFADTIVFALLIAVLIFRPSGLFAGARSREV
jgi:branched-chain amino acid transport system permease protein